TFEVDEFKAASIHQYFHDEKNRALIETLRASGLNFGERDERMPVKPASGISGTSWVITGSLSQPRDEIAELIRERGGKVSSAVSKKTSYVLAGEDAGSKLEKAKTLGVKIVSEAEFREMMKTEYAV